jgi:hypothetical protein
MPKKGKYLLLFILLLAGLALIVGNQISAQASCVTGTFAEAVFDNGEIKITYDTCTGDVTHVCFYDAGAKGGPCGDDYTEGEEVVLYICPDNGNGGADLTSCQMMTNVGPGTGCACYGSPGEVCYRGRCWTI